MKTIDRAELDLWMGEGRSFALIDVLPPAADPVGAAQPAHSAVREDFLPQLTALGADKLRPVVLYDAATAAIPFRLAAAMLAEAGFSNVCHFAGPHAELHHAQHGP